MLLGGALLHLSMSLQIRHILTDKPFSFFSWRCPLSSGLALFGVLRSLKVNSGISALILEVSFNVQSSDER